MKNELNDLEFFADFFLVPVFIALMMHYNDDGIAPAAVGVICGMLSWTLYEYLMHRFLFHGHRWFIEQHEDHHRHPKALLGNRPWMTALITVVIWSTILIIFGENNASAYTSGLLLGYLVYAGIHLNLHHGDPQTFHRPLSRLYSHHAAHHRGGTHNFGVSVIWWDYLLGTLHK